ncbi:MAG: PEP-CTERM sorting domain-containing protein [Verrucomicrobiaceae bacterium]
MKKTLILTSFACTTALASAQQTFVQTKSFGPSVLSFTDVLAFNAYNGNASDIISVEWCYHLAVGGGQMIVDNDGSQAATVNASFGGELDVSSAGLNLLDGSFNPIFDDVSAGTSSVLNLAANVGDGPGDYDPTGPDGATILGQQSSNSGSGFVHTGFHSQYAGTNPIYLTVDADAFADIGTVGGVEFASTPASASGYVTLKITAVPEPSTALLGVLGALGFVVRRKR